MHVRSTCIDKGKVQRKCGLGSEGHQARVHQEHEDDPELHESHQERILEDEVKSVQDVRQSKGNCDRKIVNSYEKFVGLSERYE